MAEIVNLRRARKAKARADKDKGAAAKRAAHGRTKAQKALEDADARKARETLDAHKRERDD